MVRSARALEPLPDALWPFAAIEVTVLGQSLEALPLEIGFARWRGPEAPIESWATHICPEIRWLDESCWAAFDDSLAAWAQRCLVALGLPVAVLCRRLDTELFGATVCCDGWEPAQVALARLYTSVGTKPLFRPVSRTRLEALAKQGMSRWLDANDRYPTSPRSRAVWIMRAFASGRRKRPERIGIR